MTHPALESMVGLIAPIEGRALADMAASVPADQAIVEIGSHRGLSSAWLATGSAEGNRAHVTCIDPWPLYGTGAPDPSIPWAEEGALEQWLANIAAVGGGPLTTPLRSTAIAVAATWAQPVGMLFHDADHAYEAVRDDYRAWQPYLASGAWIAVHDFYGSNWRGDHWQRDGSEQLAVRKIILKSGEFEDVGVVDNLWKGRRLG